MAVMGIVLFFSHLPRIIKEDYEFDQFYISCESKFRNPEISELVWQLNPFVDGEIDARGIYPKKIVNSEGNLLRGP